MPHRLLTFVVALALSAGCGPDLDFKQARHLERKGKLIRAVKAYEDFLEKYPEDPRVPSARYSAASIYATSMERCDEAVPLFESVARDNDSANEGLAEKARLGLLSCPDYFPLQAGASWTYVDSASGGKFMRLPVKVLASTGSVRALITGKYFAGKEVIQKYSRKYSKEGWAIFETKDGVKAPILKYPFHQGRTWEVRRGRDIERFKIVAAGVNLKVKAGSFKGCLKVRRRTSGRLSWVFDYYCPGVGRVKTTIGIPGGENPNTELAEYKYSGDS